MQAIPFNPAREVILPRNTQKAKREKVKHFENQELKKFLDYLDSLNLNKFRYYYEIHFISSCLLLVVVSMKL